MLGHDLDQNQWGQCLLNPRLGGLGIIDMASTAAGAYYESLLACLQPIAKIDLAQSLGLNPTLFCKDDNPNQLDSFLLFRASCSRLGSFNRSSRIRFQGFPDIITWPPFLLKM